MAILYPDQWGGTEVVIEIERGSKKFVMSGAHDGNLNKKAETLLRYNVSEHKELRETHSLWVRDKLFAVVAPCLAPEGHRVIDGAKASAIF